MSTDVILPAFCVQLSFRVKELWMRRWYEEDDVLPMMLLMVGTSVRGA
jgi:hypothetical protein